MCTTAVICHAAKTKTEWCMLHPGSDGSEEVWLCVTQVCLLCVWENCAFRDRGRRGSLPHTNTGRAALSSTSNSECRGGATSSGIGPLRYSSVTIIVSYRSLFTSRYGYKHAIKFEMAHRITDCQ